MIRQSSIDRVLSDSSILNVAEVIIPGLKKKGTYYFGYSPFSEEKTPSFVVSPSKNIWKDFSNGKGGAGAVSLVMAVERLDFISAIRKVAGICHITLEEEAITPEEQRKIDRNQQYKNFLKEVFEQYQMQLHNTSEDHWTRLMIRERGIKKKQVTNFLLGYAPSGFDFITSPAIESGKLELSKDLGLSNAKQGKSYDFFIDRLIFPILNIRGEVIGFGGRRSNDAKNFDDNGKEKWAKYLNSKDSPIYHKEKVLYGIYQAKSAILKENKAVLVEGYTDVISMHQAGVENTIATCGTALSNDQASQIKKLCNHIIIFRDGDKAGKKAAVRDIDILLAHNFKIEIVFAPDNQDPDDICRNEKNVSEWVRRNSLDAVLWRIEDLRENCTSDVYLSAVEEIKATADEKIEAATHMYNQKISDQKRKFKSTSELEKLDAEELKKANSQIANAEKQIAIFQKELEKEIQKHQKNSENSISELTKDDPYKISEAIDEISTILSLIPDEIKRNEYLKITSKAFKQKEKDLKDILIHKIKNAPKKDIELKKVMSLGVPEGGDIEQFKEDRFWEIGNSYYFIESDGFFQGTNFRIIPLFHIYGQNDNKRLCEVINLDNYKTIIDFDSRDLINYGRLQERLIDEGFFIWEGNVSNIQFKLVMKKVLREFVMAYELKTLGFQKEGFFAYADGVFFNHEFKKVNKYGVIQLDIEQEEGEYAKGVKHYYSPAFSEIYKNVREDDDPYENDRYLVYKSSPVDLETWMKQFVRVYGFEKGSIGIAFIIGTLFRDFIVRQGDFPLLGLFGEKGSGKSEYGESLQHFFFFNMPAFDLNSGTLVGFSRRLARTKNTIGYFEEYNDKIKPEMWQAMKNAYDNRGREKGSLSTDNRTTITKSNTSIMYAGQYIPQVDDGSLTERTLLLHFIKPSEAYTDQDKEALDTLTKWQDTGINSLILDIIKHRDKIVGQYYPELAGIQKELRLTLKDTDYTERMLMNYAIIMAPVKVLWDNINFPFSWKDFYGLCANSIVANSDLIQESGGMSEFWKTFEYLAGKGAIILREDYIIERVRVVKCRRKEGGTMITDPWENENKDKVLFINFTAVYKKIHREMSMLEGMEIISESTLKSYFRSKKYFIGSSVSQRMGEKVYSCYTFNYTMMEAMGYLNVEKPNLSLEEIQAYDENIISSAEVTGQLGF